MTGKLLPIVSLILAGLLGCQHQASSDAPSPRYRSVAGEAAVLPAGNSGVVMVYYFHRTLRCPTCLAIEANAQRVIETDFDDLTADGIMIWKPINLDEPAGKAAGKEFDVSVSTLLLAKMQNGHPAAYKKLEKVWSFIGNPAKFDDYIASEVDGFLSE